MSADCDYDTTNLNVLRRELARLNMSALASGLVAARDGRIEVPQKAVGRRAGKRPATQTRGRRGSEALASASPEAGKAAAGRLLALAGRIADDKTFDVPGTGFTEGGVARLLAHLGGSRRLRRNAWLRFRLQMHAFLNRPVSSGIRTVSGISIDRLQVVWRQLQDIEQNGWVRFQQKRAIRRLPAPHASGDLNNDPTPVPLARVARPAKAKR